MKVKKFILAIMLASSGLSAIAQNSYASNPSLNTSNAGMTSGSTSTNSSMQGHEGFNCASGSTYQMINGVASCKVTVVSTGTQAAPCAATTLSHGSCSFVFPKTTSGSTPTVQSSSTGYSGAGSATCTTGNWGALTASCNPNPCSPTTNAFGSCSYTSTTLTSGQSASVTTSTVGYNGAETATCSAGSLTYSGQSCAVQAPCASGTLSWTDSGAGTGASCSASVTASPSGSQVAIVAGTTTQTGTSPMGQATAACNSGTWSLVSGTAQCFSTTKCAATTSTTFAQLNAESPTYGPLVKSTWGNGCGATLNFPATANAPDLVGSPIVQSVASTSAGTYYGYASYGCNDQGSGFAYLGTSPGNTTSYTVSGWMDYRAMPMTCADSAASTACAKPYIAYTVDSCANMSRASSMPWYGGNGSGVLGVSSTCDSTTGGVWNATTNTVGNSYPHNTQTQGFCSSSATSAYLTPFLGFPQSAPPLSASGTVIGTYSPFSYTSGATTTVSQSLLFNSNGTWSVQWSANGSVATTTNNGTWKSASAPATATFEYQIFATQNLNPVTAGSTTYNGLMMGSTPGSPNPYLTSETAYKTISGSMVVAACTTGGSTNKNCDGLFVINVRQVGTTTPVQSIVVELAAHNH